MGFVLCAGKGTLENGLWVLLNKNGTTFLETPSWRNGLPPYILRYGYGSQDIKLADVNGDGWLDVISTMGNNGGTEPWRHEARAYFVWTSDGRGNWSNSSRGFPTGDPVRLIVGHSVDLADYDNDGYLDIFMTFLNGSYEVPADIRVSSLVIYQNDGNAN